MKKFGSRILVSLIVASVSASLAGCGGRTSAAMPAVAGNNGSTNAPAAIKTASATFAFTVPIASTSSQRRAPSSSRAVRYVSAATKSIQLTLNSASAASPAPPPVVTQVVNVPNGTGSAPGAPCSPSGPNYVCTMTLQLPIGTDGLTFTTYDANNGAAGGGNVLSKQTTTVTIVQGVANGPGGPFAITLDANVNVMTVSGSGSCQNGPIGSSFGSVGTTPVTFTVGYTDPAGKTIVAPGLPKLSVTATGVTGGTIGVTVTQSTQSYVLTPSATGVSGTINVQSVQADTNAPTTDGLAFTKTKSYTFSTGPAPPSHNFLAAVEQFGVGSGAVDFFNVTLGGSGGPDSFAAFSPATLATTASNGGSGPQDVDNPLDLVWDSNGDLLIGNGGTTTGTPQDNGNLACVPVGAISTGANASTTVTSNVDDPVGIAYDPRDGSVALANNPNSAAEQLDEFLLTGNYTAAATGRDLAVSGFGSFGLTNIPTSPAGTYAIALTTGLENDPAHNTGSAKIAIITPTSSTTSSEADILPSGAGTNCTANPCAIPATYGIDIPHQIAWDPNANQLVIANNSAFHKLLTFYTTSGTQVFAINTGLRNDKVAVSPDGHVAVSGSGSFGFDQVKVYDNTAARNAVNGPIPFNGTTTSCGSTYEYPQSLVNSLTWLSNTKLLIALQSYNGSVATAQNGLYIFDISTTAVPAGFDDVSCSAFAAAPKQSGFVHLNNKPLGTAYKP